MGRRIRARSTVSFIARGDRIDEGVPTVCARRFGLSCDICSELRGEPVDKQTKADDREIILKNNPRLLCPPSRVHQLKIQCIVFPQADRRDARRKPHQGRERRLRPLDNIQLAIPGGR
jgi:hypothetical protein